MITVYHWAHDPFPDVTWNGCDAMTGEDTFYQACYFAGIEEPNYPLPAIRQTVEILPTRVVLWTHSPRLDYKYLA